MAQQNTILLGAVAYDPKVVTIWEKMREHFQNEGVPMDFALFSNYERQVEELLAGHIDIAWNTPLAHVRVQKRTNGRSLSLGMRDSDRDFSSRLIVRKDAHIRALGDLAGKRLAVGSADSTQARILPLYFLAQQGLNLDQVSLVPFDTDLGKHGDTGTSELDVLAALTDGRAEAGTIGELIWVLQLAAGKIDTQTLESVWVSPPFDHCMFDALPTLDPNKVQGFNRALFAMHWENPHHRPILEMEGLKQWMPPRESGYDSLRHALSESNRW